jgi:hypothetical protein
VNGAIVIFDVPVCVINTTSQTALTTFDEIRAVVIDVEANHVTSYCISKSNFNLEMGPYTSFPKRKCTHSMGELAS